MTREGSQHTGKGWNPANRLGRDISIKLRDGLPSARTATDQMGWAPQWWQWRRAGPRIWPSCPGNHSQTYSLPMCGESTHDLPTENRENLHCRVFCFLSVLKSRCLRTKTTGPNTKTNKKRRIIIIMMIFTVQILQKFWALYKEHDGWWRRGLIFLHRNHTWCNYTLSTTSLRTYTHTQI